MKYEEVLNRTFDGNLSYALFVMTNGDTDGYSLDIANRPTLDIHGVAGSPSRYMFDNDDDIEFLVLVGTDVYLSDYSTYPSTEGGLIISDARLPNIVQEADGAYLRWRASSSLQTFERKLAGNTPDYDYQRRLYSLYQPQASPGRVDTVYQVTTERIFTSDTVYLQETITLDGDVDTIFVNRTTTERIFTSDTVYSFDEVVILGQYSDDTQLVLSTDKLDTETLDAYPNPASDVVTIPTRTTQSGELRVYDMSGSVVKRSNVGVGFNEYEVNVSDLKAGMYVYMVVTDTERSKTRKLIVN